MQVSRATVPPELHERYGLKPRNKFLVGGLWAFSLLLVLLLFLQINRGQQSDVETRLVSWQANSQNTVEITWSVYQSGNLPVTCVLKAQDEDQFDVGFALFETEDTGSVKTYSHTLNTISESYAVLTPVCELNASSLLGPHFRPGILPPAQNSPLFAPWQWNS